MNQVYFPSCNFSAASPEAAKKIRALLAERMPVAGCCRVEKKAYVAGAKAIYFCQACRETIETKMGAEMETENLIVYLDHDDTFSWPDYSGFTATIQDCWRDREHPEIFDAVRSVLHKMHVTVIEMEENREKSVFCGNLHFEPQKPENKELLARYPDTPLFQLPEDIQAILMREQVEKFPTMELLPCEWAVCYCNRCVKGITAGGGKAVHLLELAMGTFVL